MDNTLFFKENQNIPIMEIQISNKKIIITQYLTMDISRKYLEECEKTQNYRKEFCQMIYDEIKDIDYKNQNISISEINYAKDEDLIIIINRILNNENDLKKCFNKEFNGDYFKTIYLVIKKRFESLDKLQDKWIKKVIYTIQQLPCEIKSIHKEFLKFGWYFYRLNEECKYFSQTIKNIKYLKSIIKNDKTDIANSTCEIDNYMNNLIKVESQKIIENITNNFPKRCQIIKDCYEAHNNKLYTLSIPVFLSQIDGIAVEIVNGNSYNDSLFTKKREKIFSKLKEKIAENTFEYLYYVYPLEFIANECCPIGIPTNKRNNKIKNNEIYSNFNRNGILHGIDTDYNNETNSNKCIAILGHLACLKEIYDSYSNE